RDKLVTGVQTCALPISVRRREHEPGDGIRRTGELEPVRPPYGEIGAPAGLERAAIVEPEYGSAATRPEAKRVPCSHRRRTAAPEIGRASWRGGVQIAVW